MPSSAGMNELYLLLSGRLAKFRMEKKKRVFAFSNQHRCPWAPLVSHRAACRLCFIQNILPASPAAGGEGEEGRSHSPTKANLFVSKEKLSAPLPDEGINKIWRHLDAEWEKSRLQQAPCSSARFEPTLISASKQKGWTEMNEGPSFPCWALIRQVKEQEFQSFSRGGALAGRSLRLSLQGPLLLASRQAFGQKRVSAVLTAQLQSTVPPERGGRN